MKNIFFRKAIASAVLTTIIGGNVLLFLPEKTEAATFSVFKTLQVTHKNNDTYFYLANISKVLSSQDIANININNLTSKYIDAPADTAKLPVGLQPEEISDLFDAGGKQDKGKNAAWNAISKLYAQISSKLNRTDPIGAGLAARCNQEINRKKSASLASYERSSSEPFTVYNISKVIKKQTEREKLNDLTGSPAQLNSSDILVLEPTFDYNTIKITTENKITWTYISMVYKTIMSSASVRKQDEKQAETDYNQTKMSSEEIDKAIKAFNPNQLDYVLESGNFAIDNIPGKYLKIQDKPALEKIGQIGFMDVLADDTIKLYIKSQVNSNDVTEINYTTAGIWTKIQRIYETIAKYPKNASDKQPATTSASAIQEKLSKYKPPRVYERLEDNFLVINYAQRGIDKAVETKINETDTTSLYLQDGHNALIPADINDVLHPEDGDTLTPKQYIVWQKIAGLYQAVANDAKSFVASNTKNSKVSSTEISKKNEDLFLAQNSLQAIQNVISLYHTENGCAPGNNAVQVANNRFVICNATKAIGANKIKQINDFANGGNLGFSYDNESDEVLIDQSYDPGANYTLNTSALQTVRDVYSYIINVISTDDKDIPTSVGLVKNAAGSIQNIDIILKGPKPYSIDLRAMDHAVAYLHVFDLLPSCTNIKDGDDPNVQVFITDFVDGKKHTRCDISAGNLISEKPPIVGSRAHQIILSTLAEAKRLDPEDKTGDVKAIQDFLSYFLTIALKESGNDTFKVFAPTKFQLTEEAYKYAQKKEDLKDFIGPLPESSTPSINSSQVFANYPSGAIDIQYQLDKNKDLLDKMSATSEDMPMPYLLFNIADSKGDKEQISNEELKNNSEASSENATTVEWKFAEYVQSHIVSPGKYSFEFILYSNNTAEPITEASLTNDTIITKITHSFSVVAPNGETSFDGYSLGDEVGFSLQKDKGSIKQGETAKFHFTLTNHFNAGFKSPVIDATADPKTEKDFKDVYHVWITKNATTENKVDTIPEDGWEEIKTSQYRQGDSYQQAGMEQTTFPISLEWKTDENTPTGQHYIRIKTFRKNLATNEVKLTGTFDKKATLTINPSGSDDDDGSGNGGGNINAPGGKIKSLQDLYIRFKKLFFILIPSIAVTTVIIGGIIMMTAAGNEKNAERGKKTVIYAVIAVIIAVLAYTIVNAALGAINLFIKK